MTFDGLTCCPVCRIDIARELRDVLRKAEDRDTMRFDCPRCDAPIAVKVRIVHYVEIEKD